jgi:protein tyrosine/serine phosphatase
MNDYVKITEGIFVGSVNSSKTIDTGFLKYHDIDSIIALSIKVNSDFDIFDFVLPNDELLDFEYEKYNNKLESICVTIKDLRDNNRGILIVCNDGKNKSMSVAGYYLITRGGMDSDQVINYLETIRFTPQQRADELRIAEALKKSIEFDKPLILSQEEQQKQTIRRELKCLTMKSYKQLLTYKRKTL